MDSFPFRWVSHDPRVGAEEAPRSWGLPGIARHIPYTPLVFASVRRPRLGPLASQRSHITLSSLGWRFPSLAVVHARSHTSLA